MKEYFLMFVSFVTLFLVLFWIQVLVARSRDKDRKSNYKPKVSIIIPAYNEENNIKQALDSLLALDYPEELLELIVVNDGSTDNTESIVRSYGDKRVVLVNKERGGKKAAAVNAGIEKASGELIGVLDADSIVEKDSLKNMLHHFDEKNVGAVITLIKVKNPRNIFEKVQHLEYIFSGFARKLMTKIDTLFVTPGVLTLYRKDLIDKYGGFDEENLTEDLEIAMRLRYNGHSIKIETEAVTYTEVPRTFMKLWNQRIRWFRGYLFNTKKYKDMFFSKKYGFLGMFQVPLNFLTVFMVILTFILFFYESLRRLYEFLIKLFVYRADFIKSIEIPTLKELIFKLDMKLLFPIMVSFVLGLYVYHKAHQSAKEKWKFPIALLIYITVYPALRIVHWISALILEIMGSKKKW